MRGFLFGLAHIHQVRSGPNDYTVIRFRRCTAADDDSGNPSRDMSASEGFQGYLGIRANTFGIDKRRTMADSDIVSVSERNQGTSITM
ncbi:uncharacterized protein K489DRAFT_180074 [Dissoconium aciculare CBS 342.82]|uniref:Uncharacterized protein n=1 Tax=Dissoconium aciculare CBS 342.82 TaxID=1314786 RepID=A0A6J3MBV8_9PEZI|nr:uncharacterized protein K489DRAFT_180074 [Dissoconium aciculare CBS 342.82]KAF1824327.1 hypothetical protein K489DRAFT_180074 [Dissoconium aciculare CBS 342.82]